MRFTVAKKLNLLFSSILLLGIGGAIFLATQLYTSDLESLLRRKTLDIASLLAGRIQTEMKRIVELSQFIGETSLAEFRFGEDRLSLLKRIIASDPRIISVASYSLHYEKQDIPPTPHRLWRIFNPATTAKKFSPDLLDHNLFPFHLQRLQNSEADFKISRDPNHGTLCHIAVPILKNQLQQVERIITLDLDLIQLTSLFTSSVDSTNLLLDHQGIILQSNDPLRNIPGSSLQNTPLFQLKSKSALSPNGQMIYPDEQNIIQMGAYHTVGFSGLTVISQIPMSQAHLAQKILFRRGFWLAGFFLFSTLGIGMLFSRSLTSRIQKLAQATQKVSQGDLNVQISTKKEEARGDEVNQLTHDFNHMVNGLKEREKMRNILEKFHNPEITHKLMSGNLQLGGERYQGTVLFVDLRGFTALSETQSPETVVKTVNIFLTHMVDIILKHHGIIDKYIGDSILAVWGVPDKNPSAIEDALFACIDMRKALVKLNRTLNEMQLPSLKIGMGLNHGPLVAGIIGSEERMEFTVIGDSVNTASRIESLTKLYKSDLLINESVATLAQKRFILEKIENVQIRGKKELSTLYKVLGYKDLQTNQDILVHTPFSSWEDNPT